MKRVLGVLGVVVLIGLLALVGWRIFEHFDQQGKIKNANKACTSFDVVTGTPVLPSGFTLPTDQKLLNVTQAGKTYVVFASLPGGRADLVHIRDTVAQEMATLNGYQVSGGDQEPTFEADGSIKKDGNTDTINVRPLCSGRVVVRYTLHR